MRVLHVCILAFLFASSSTALSQDTVQRVEGNLEFIPYQDYVDASVELKRGPERDADVYKERPTDTEWPFRFRITVDPDVPLKELYVKVVVRDPEGYYCKLRSLRASESERLINIPMCIKEDLFYSAKQEMKGAIDAGNIDEAKSKLAQVRWWATSPGQVVVPCLDVADFLSKYKSERGNVVKILTDVLDWAGAAGFGIQQRYWRLRRDATMRLAGYNDFKKIPVEEFAESVAYIENPIAWKAWTDFTVSFAQSYKENYDKWEMMTKARLTQVELNSLWVFYPNKQEVLGQLRSLNPVIGPAIVPR